MFLKVINVIVWKFIEINYPNNKFFNEKLKKEWIWLNYFKVPKDGDLFFQTYFKLFIFKLTFRFCIALIAEIKRKLICSELKKS